MSQNLITMTVSPEQIVAIDGAIDTLHRELPGLVALTVQTRRFAPKMGTKSEAFCRQTLSAMRLYPHAVPTSVDIDDAEADLAVLDLLRPRFQRLRGLAERAADSELALGSDVMSAALDGYKHLKIAGKSQGLKGLSKELGVRFAKSPRQEPEPEPTAT